MLEVESADAQPIGDSNVVGESVQGATPAFVREEAAASGCAGERREGCLQADDAVVPDAAATFFLKSVVFPKMSLAETAWRELRRLNCTLVLQSAMQMPGAAENWADHRELLRRLKLAAGRPDEESDEYDTEDELQDAIGGAPHSTNAFGIVEGGEEAVRMLFDTDAAAGSRKQQAIVTWFLEHIRACDFDRSLDPARVLLHGPGGCGKSVVVRALATLLRRERVGVALAAPTGCAAFLINGATLHSCLHLPVENASFGRAEDAPLPEGPMLQNLLDFWKPVRVLIIDEVSMVSSEMLGRIDVRLRVYKRRQEQPFGGIAILLCGDLYQLSPPRGQAVFAAEVLWRLFSVCELSGNHRAAQDPEFAALLERVRVGRHTDRDVALLQSRVLPPPSGSAAPHLLARRVDVARVNQDQLEEHVAGRELRAVIDRAEGGLASEEEIALLEDLSRIAGTSRDARHSVEPGANGNDDSSFDANALLQAARGCARHWEALTQRAQAPWISTHITKRKTNSSGRGSTVCTASLRVMWHA